MSFVSYAQNFEDVMLWRALKHIDCGFYIDVGAQDPVIDSVTKSFYDHGWRGVHIEPNSKYADMLRQARPDEIVEHVAIAGSSGSLTFYEFDDTGLSTADPEIAERHQRDGFSMHETTVDVVSMDMILERYGHRDIHWLKIDVEGLEKSVIESWSGALTYPWVLVIESTQPLSQEIRYQEWEHILLDKGYQYAYFDGVNRFYVHKDHSELLSSFKIPPNYFDDFVLSTSHYLARLAVEQYRQAEHRAQQAENRIWQAEDRAQQLEHTIHEIYASHSWHITAPLRAAGSVARWFVQGLVAWVTFAPMSRPRRILREVVIHLREFCSSHPLLQKFGLRFVSLFPRLKTRLKMVRNELQPAEDNFTIAGPKQLPPRARQIYNDLLAAVEQRGKERL